MEARAAQYDPPWADALWAHWPVSEDGVGLDTTASMNLVKRNLSDERVLHGYHSYSTNPSSAKAALGTLYAQSDAIWWMAGHAGPGLITTYHPTNGGSWLYIDGNSTKCDGSSGRNQCLSEHTWSQMHDIRLMLFFGCESGDTDGTGYSLPRYAKQVLGVDASLGFSNLIYFAPTMSDTFAHYFTSYGILDYTVTDAAWGAAEAVRNASGAYNGFNSLVIYGGSTLIYPAEYGT